MSFFCCSVKGVSITNVISNFVWANKRISGQFSHARITWTKEECSFNPGLRYSPVDTCAYLFYLFLFFFFFNFLLDSHGSHGSHYDSHGSHYDSHGSHYDSHGSHYDSHGSLARMLVNPPPLFILDASLLAGQKRHFQTLSKECFRSLSFSFALHYPPLVFFPLFRSLSFSFALHYLNAWNRLAEWFSVALSVDEKFVFNQFYSISILFGFLWYRVELFSCFCNLFRKLISNPYLCSFK